LLVVEALVEGFSAQKSAFVDIVTVIEKAVMIQEEKRTC
jgi:hypothetical protein